MAKASAQDVLSLKIDTIKEKVESIESKLDQSYITRIEFDGFRAESDRRTASLEESRKWLAYTVFGFIIVGILGYFFIFTRGIK